MSDILDRFRAVAEAISNLPPSAPFKPWFRKRPGQHTPTAILALNANAPLVRAYEGHREMRYDVVQAARIPGLYVEGLSLTAMGGEPYSIWN